MKSRHWFVFISALLFAPALLAQWANDPVTQLTTDDLVGIGTSAPAARLHVFGSTLPQFVIEGPYEARLQLKVNGTSKFLLNHDGERGVIGTQSGGLQLQTTSVVRAYIAHDQFHVGIGAGVGPNLKSLNVSAFSSSSVLTVSSLAGSAGQGVLELGTDLDAVDQTAGTISFFNRTAASNRFQSAAISARADSSGTALDRGYSLQFSTKPDSGAAVERVRITSAGQMVIGSATDTLTQKLAVHGDVYVRGNIAAKFQDLAEWVPASEDLDDGVVVVLDPSATNQVMASSHAYDTAVAGVVSAMPGIILGERGESKEQIATTGRVKVRVDATAAPIRVGDLLVTSSKPGMAMRSQPIDVGGIAIHRPGTVIGKALEPLPEGTGEILVLLSLQ